VVSVAQSLPDSGELTAEIVAQWLAGQSQQRSAKDIDRLTHAIALMQKIHAGETNTDGMSRSLALLHTAHIADSLKLDTDTLLSIFLSELPTRADFSADQIAEQFGADVVTLIQQVARLREISHRGAKTEAQNIESLRRLLLELAGDVRVILIVLVKRLRLMRYLKNTDAELQRVIAHETRQVHAPLANRLGIWTVKWELEDLCLRFLEPDHYKNLAKQLDGKRLERESFVENFLCELSEICEEADIHADVMGRPKHIFSIWNKMRQKQLTFEQLFDVRAVRMLVETVAQCYEVLGLVHSQWKPIAKEFDDYIANPKPNGYASLHTAVIASDGKPVEIQIRTHQMHDHAERGVAAHWMYKEAKASDAALESRVSMMRNWLSQEVTTHEADADEAEYEAQRIYVLTPQNKVIELSAGATPVDFAYAVHSSVGDRCRGAKINGQMATLTRKLQSGDVVEIITAKQGGPSRDWLNVSSGYVTTSKARNRIKHWFKQQDYEEDLHEGRAALDRECHRTQIPKAELDQLAKRFNFKNVDDLYAAIGRGDVSAIQVANTLQPKTHETDEEVDEKIRKRTKKPAKPDSSSGPVIVGGVNDLLTHVARCCKPVPPDPVIGFITRGRGITVHHQNCRVVDQIDEANRDRLIDVAWNAHSKQRRYVVDILVEAYDRKGLLRDITSVFTHADVDVLAVKTRSDKRHERAKMRFSVEIAELAELERVMSQLAQVPDVQSVGRQV